jgi:hypothetical protein
MANSTIEPGVYLDIHEATAYAGRPIQVSINKLDADGGGHGYRIAGPKFTLNGARLLRRVKLDARSAAEIRRYLDRIPAVVPQTPSAEERELRRVTEALGPDVLQRWEDGDAGLDLAAEVAALRGIVAGYRRTLDEALNSGDGSYRP